MSPSCTWRAAKAMALPGHTRTSLDAPSLLRRRAGTFSAGALTPAARLLGATVPGVAWCGRTAAGGEAAAPSAAAAVGASAAAAAASCAPAGISVEKQMLLAMKHDG